MIAARLLRVLSLFVSTTHSDSGLLIALAKRAVLVIGMMLSAGAAQAGVLTTLNFGNDGLDITTARLPGSGDYCSDPLGQNRPCFSDTTVTFTGHGVIEHVSLTATLNNPFTLGELSLSLRHAGVIVHLFENASHSTQFSVGVTITFDDLAADPLPVFPLVDGTFRPDSPLSAFNGLDASGDWTLTIGDLDQGDVSRYSGAVLAVTTPEPASLLLLVSGFVGLVGMEWRRHRRKYSPHSSP